MTRDILPLGVQSLGILAALALAVFAPQPGRASLLVPVVGQATSHSYGQAALWASDENAQIIRIAPQSGAVTVIAPSGRSLARALSYGLVPIAAEIPACNSAGEAGSSGESSREPVA